MKNMKTPRSWGSKIWWNIKGDWGWSFAKLGVFWRCLQDQLDYRNSTSLDVQGTGSTALVVGGPASTMWESWSVLFASWATEVKRHRNDRGLQKMPQRNELHPQSNTPKSHENPIFELFVSRASCVTALCTWPTWGIAERWPPCVAWQRGVGKWEKQAALGWLSCGVCLDDV